MNEHDSDVRLGLGAFDAFVVMGKSRNGSRPPAGRACVLTMLWAKDYKQDLLKMKSIFNENRPKTPLFADSALAQIPQARLEQPDHQATVPVGGA